VEFSVLASPTDPFDPMDKAFKAIGEKYLAGTGHLHNGWALVREYPLSEKLPALSHVWSSPQGDRYVVAAKGAPEAIADLCHLRPEEGASQLAQVEVATNRGLRVLGVGRASFRTSASLPTEQHDFDFHYLGLAALQDPVRPGVAEAVAECSRAGVRAVMITGDYPGTALAIAREVGLNHRPGGHHRHRVDRDVGHRTRSTDSHSERLRPMVPEQKLRLIRALRANDEVVGMTGDGVNDAPALRAADIGIAMGKRGTDVAREAAALVITDDEFSSIASGIRQGRASITCGRRCRTSSPSTSRS
jgi:Ca2+-transporting ATPase